MSDYTVRLVTESESRATFDVFRGALHRPRLTDQQWRTTAQRYDPDRVFGAFSSDGSVVGTAMSFPSSLAVPGGGELPAEAVVCVGVRADHTRRGVLTELMRTQLEITRQRGQTFAVLHASETAIYGRYGYGPATWAKRVVLPRREAVLRSAAPSGGHVRLVDVSEATALLPGIYRSLPRRAGMIERVDTWWGSLFGRSGEGLRVAVHANEHGVDDGFVLYSAMSEDFRPDEPTAELRVDDFHASDTMAAVDLWRFLLNVDLVTEVHANRPVDEPFEWWLTDPRALQVQAVADELWVRILDVPAALRGRSFGEASPVVVEVRDSLFPDNGGCYRITSDGGVRCGQDPQISMDIDVLGALFLGGVSGRVLAEANRIDVHDPGAVAELDNLFRTELKPWCGTGF